MRRVLLAVALLVALVAATPPAAAGMPRPAHVLVVVFENKGYGEIVGNPQAPYLNSLLPRSAVLTQSYGVTHPSEPNYLALFSGSTQGVTSDACVTSSLSTPNLATQLRTAGLTFAGYSEGLPSPGYTGCTSGRYAAKHNPWVDFTNVPASANQPYSALPSEDRLPTVSFVVPDLCNDMHDCPVSTGDAWARTHLAPYVEWARAHQSLLVLTFDEDDGAGGNHILTLFAGAGIRPGQYATHATHYTVLRTIEALYGLPPLAQTTGTAPLNLTS